MRQRAGVASIHNASSVLAKSASGTWRQLPCASCQVSCRAESRTIAAQAEHSYRMKPGPTAPCRFPIHTVPGMLTPATISYCCGIPTI